MKRASISKRLLAAKHCVSKDPTRYVLRRVKVTREEVVATDGRVLVAIKNTEAQPDGEDGEFLLDPDMVQFAESLMRGKGPKPVIVEMEEDKISVTGFVTTWKSAQIEMEMEQGLAFPKTEQTIPTDASKLFSVSVELLEKVVKTAKAAGINSLEIRQGENRVGPLLLVGDEENFRIVLMPRRD